MPVTPQEGFRVAERLRVSEDNEAGFRAVVNRAYYAAHQAADIFHRRLSAPGSVGNSSGRHEQLLNQLYYPTVSKSSPDYGVSKGIYKALRLAYGHRITADYSLSDPFIANCADDTLKAAATVIRESLRIEFP